MAAQNETPKVLSLTYTPTLCNCLLRQLHSRGARYNMSYDFERKRARVAIDTLP